MGKRRKADSKATPRTFQEGAKIVSKECLDLLIKKHYDYGPENILAFEGYGQDKVFFALLTRITDKLARLTRLSMTGKKPKNETIEDTLRDLSNYAQIWLLVRKGWFRLPLKEDLGFLFPKPKQANLH